MKRRNFLKLGGAGVAGAVAVGTGLLSWTARARATSIVQTYYITSGSIAQGDGASVYFEGFSSSETGLDVPAKPFIVQEGDNVSVTIINTLSQSHSFVIDGVVNSGPIAAGKIVTVSFTAPQAGSYFFYDALNAPYNRLVGLHGGMAVMPSGISNQLYAGSPTFVQQYFWVFNDIDPTWNSAIQKGITPTTAYTPKYFTINGLGARPPGAPDAGNPDVDAMSNLKTRLQGSVGDRTLIRVFNAGQGTNSVHWHGNHVEWLTQNGQIRPAIWLKDAVPLRGNMGSIDVIYPFSAPPDAYPPVTTGIYPMHLHNEMTQTSGGGLYLFGALTDIEFA